MAFWPLFAATAVVFASYAPLVIMLMTEVTIAHGLTGLNSELRSLLGMKL